MKPSNANVYITLFYRNIQVNMAISMKSALVMAILIIGLVQTVKSACPNYGMVYGNCGSDIESHWNVSWQECARLCKNLRGNSRARGIICGFKCPREINNKLSVIDSTNSFWVIDKSYKCFVQF